LTKGRTSFYEKKQETGQKRRVLATQKKAGKEIFSLKRRDLKKENKPKSETSITTQEKGEEHGVGGRDKSTRKLRAGERKRYTVEEGGELRIQKEEKSVTLDGSPERGWTPKSSCSVKSN